MPRSAALALALRKMASGISRVVFIDDQFPIFMGNYNKNGDPKQSMENPVCVQEGLIITSQVRSSESPASAVREAVAKGEFLPLAS